MTEVVIRNTQLLEKLNSIVDELRSIPDYDDRKHHVFSSEKHILNGEYYCSDEWLNHKLDNWESHSGFPEEHFAQPLSTKAKIDPDKFLGLHKKGKVDFTSEIGASHSALFNYYAPGGFVGWHTNWNANCYQILFTWSETGDGYFKYYDKAKKEVVTIQDVPGWQCRHYYFGRKDEPDHHCWHSAYAGCDRITLAYKFVNEGINDPMDATARLLRDQLIEDIEMQ